MQQTSLDLTFLRFLEAQQDVQYCSDLVEKFYLREIWKNVNARNKIL